MVGAISPAAERLDAPSQGNTGARRTASFDDAHARRRAWPLRVPRVSRMENGRVRPVTGLPDPARPLRYGVRGISKRKALPAPGALDTVMLP